MGALDGRGRLAPLCGLEGMRGDCQWRGRVGEAGVASGQRRNGAGTAGVGARRAAGKGGNAEGFARRFQVCLYVVHVQARVVPGAETAGHGNSFFSCLAALRASAGNHGEAVR